MTRPGTKETVDRGYLTVHLLGSGYAAVHMVNVTLTDVITGKVVGEYEDVQQTGLGRYRTRKEAVLEAREWAESDEIPCRV